MARTAIDEAKKVLDKARKSDKTLRTKVDDCSDVEFNYIAGYAAERGWITVISRPLLWGRTTLTFTKKLRVWQ